MSTNRENLATFAHGDLEPIDLTANENFQKLDNKKYEEKTPSTNSCWSVDDILQKKETKVPDYQELSRPVACQKNVEQAKRTNEINVVLLRNEPIVSLMIDGKERLCLAQISSTLLKHFSYNEIHNRRVALGINCVQCTPVQLEILRRHGAMPISSRRCGMITKREAERLVASFLEEHSPPKLPETFSFQVYHTCGWGCKGNFVPSRYNSSRAKCIKCNYCSLILSPNKFIFHFHRMPSSKYHHPDAANFNSWRRHLFLDYETPSDELSHAWEDVKAMFNGGSRKRSSNDFNFCKNEGKEKFWNKMNDQNSSFKESTSQMDKFDNSEQRKFSSFSLSFLCNSTSSSDCVKNYFNRSLNRYSYFPHYVNRYPLKTDVESLKRCGLERNFTSATSLLVESHKQIFLDSDAIPSHCFAPPMVNCLTASPPTRADGFLYPMVVEGALRGSQLGLSENQKFALNCEALNRESTEFENDSIGPTTFENIYERDSKMED